MYAGECQGPGVRSDFEMVHLRRVPSQYTRLSGLLDIFKSKIVSFVEQAAIMMIKALLLVSWLNVFPEEKKKQPKVIKSLKLALMAGHC